MIVIEGAIAQSIMAVFMFGMILPIEHGLFLRLSQEDSTVLSSNPILATLSSDQKEPSARQASWGGDSGGICRDTETA